MRFGFRRRTSERREGLGSEVSRWISSATSSSISVVSVPLDVTGDGPTISLGLMTLKDELAMRWIEPGRREDESVLGGEELE